MISRGRKAVERFFSNVCNVSIMEKVQTDWGETREVATVIMENVPCRRINSRDKFKNYTLFNSNSETFTLLFSKDISMKKGNQIALFSKGEFVNNYHIITNPFEYETHKEVLIESC